MSAATDNCGGSARPVPAQRVKVDWTDRAQVSARYHEEAARYPLLAEKVSLELYLRRNLRPAR